ncbi:MAG TPA: ABC transporter permease [Candidatus Polarisedimenticolaceae bacterium]|nr:ABC transporter permease [Candidatus Polarisedimenticolaceae bacterium]
MSDPRFRKRLTTAHLFEGARLALDALLAHRLRSSLVILGVAIAVATLMGMVAILSGLQAKIVADVKGGDTPTFSISRFDHVEGGDWRDMLHRPVLTADDADAILALPEIEAVEIAYGEGDGRVLRQGKNLARLIFVRGTNLSFQKFAIVDIAGGRFFTEREQLAAQDVCVLAERTAQEVFPYEDPIGRKVRIDDTDFEVVGVFGKYESLFGAIAENFAVIPYTTYERRYAWRDESPQINCFPVGPEAVEPAVEATRAILRSRHHLGPAEKDDFSILTSDAAMEFVGKITGPVSLVLVIISSIGLMVGGIGVLIIMLVSVTERTAEIGLRKAVGASRREILWQFLLEAAVLTLIGGILGIGGGLALAKAATQLIAFPFVLPVLWIVIAVGVSAGLGLVFGLYPANRAARLDPIASLRYE